MGAFSLEGRALADLGAQLREVREERDACRRRYIAAARALREIANADYRGSRSWESQRAHRALTEDLVDGA